MPARSPFSDSERFWMKVLKTDSCWLWQASLTRGYGRFTFCDPDRERKSAAVHRYAYEQLVGPIPEGLVLDHLCRVTNCVNPDHLEPVTDFENRARGLKSPLKTTCNNGHEYTPENTYWYKRERSCRTCRRIWGRKNDAARRHKTLHPIRAWAESNGLDIPRMGPIPPAIRQAYSAAHEEVSA